MVSKILLAILLGIIIPSSQQIQASCEHENGGKCTGSSNCSSCKNCSYCEHCNSGGSCGVCGIGNSRNYGGGSNYTLPPSKPIYKFGDKVRITKLYNTPNTLDGLIQGFAYEEVMIVEYDIKTSWAKVLYKEEYYYAYLAGSL